MDKKAKVSLKGFKLIPKDYNGIILAVKRLTALLTGVRSKDNGNFYFLNFLHSFRTKNELESHKAVCENKRFL